MRGLLLLSALLLACPQSIEDGVPPDDDDVAVDDDDVTVDDDDTSTDDDDLVDDDDLADDDDDLADDDTTPDDDDTTSDDDDTTPDDDDTTPDDDDTPLPYPEHDPYLLKGLQPDFWPDHDEVAGNLAGRVSMNLVWAFWEPSPQAPPCASNQQEHDNRCFTVDAAVDAAIDEYTSRGVHVTAIVYGVPAWARTTRPCNTSPGMDIFCAPDDPADYGRFAGMLAARYDGLSGPGRVIDFVIHNEVNSNTWFNVGCGAGTPCDTATWLDAYAASFNAAHDAISVSQPDARILVSLDHHFGTAYDTPAAANPLLSGETVLLGLDARSGSRPWRVAFHPYPPNLLAPEFAPTDYPKVTFGNVGVIAGWLRATFPGHPERHEVHLTEQGINAISPSSEAEQADQLCAAFRNITGTPGIVSFLYHRMSDHPVEVAQGLGLGLRRADGTARPAWSTWALANRFDLSPPQLDCGFEHLPFTRLVRGYRPGDGHRASTRDLPAGFAEEQAWLLEREELPGTTLLFECEAGDHSLLSTASSCEGLLPLGPVGWIHDAAGPGLVELFRCYVPSTGDHLVSPDPGCEGQTTESSLGFAWPG